MKYSKLCSAIAVAFGLVQVPAFAGVLMCNSIGPNGSGLASQGDMALVTPPNTAQGTTMAEYMVGAGDDMYGTTGQGPLGFIAGATTATTCPANTVPVGYAATVDELQSMISSGGNTGGGSGNPNAVLYNNGGTPSNPNTVTVANGVNNTDAANIGQLNDGVASAVSTSNNYTNTQVSNAINTVNQYTDTQVAGAINIANNYTDTKVADTLDQAIAYTDGKTKYFAANSTGAAASATGADSVAIGPASVSSGERAFAAGAGATASASDAIAIGSTANSSAAGAIAMGSGSAASGIASVALGQGSAAAGESSVALGNAAAATGANAVALGNGAQAVGTNSISIGTGNVVSGNGSGAIGDPSSVTGNASYSVGNNNTIAQDNTFVFGNGVTTTQANSVVLGNASTDRAATTETGTTINGTAYTFAGQGSTAAGVVSVGAAGVERQVVNVAAGAITATSTDAVNGSQLYATNVAVDRLGTNVNNLGQSTATIFGGGSTYDLATGTVSAPTYTVNHVTYNNVGGAIDAIGGTITQNNSGNRPPASATGSNSVAIGSGSNATRDNTVDFGGRQITGIAPGTQDTDASTMGQLREATAQTGRDANAYTDRSISALDAKSQKMMSGIGAMAMAASALAPNARAEGNVSVSAAAGTYNGESALAAGVNYYVSNQLLVNARIGLTSSGPAQVGAAVGVTWGF